MTERIVVKLEESIGEYEVEEVNEGENPVIMWWTNRLSNYGTRYEIENDGPIKMTSFKPGEEPSSSSVEPDNHYYEDLKDHLKNVLSIARQQEKARQIDFSQFWVRFRKPSGEVSSGAAFDETSFSSMFGNEAAESYNNYAHFTDNPPDTDEGRQKLSNAIDTIRRSVGVEPDVISRATSNARIENV